MDSAMLFVKNLGEMTAFYRDVIGLRPIEETRREDWIEWVNTPQTSAEEAAVLHCLRHGRPYGSEGWTKTMESRLKLPPLRKRGRPRKKAE